MHILVVDDEEDVLFIFKVRFRDWVKKQIAKLSFAHSGDEALEVLASDSGRDIILILSDIRMPGITGVELAEVVRKKYPHIITILISAYSKEKYRAETEKVGAFEFFEKPVDFAKLKRCIHKIFPYLEEQTS